jgi:hypothetical protein
LRTEGTEEDGESQVSPEAENSIAQRKARGGRRGKRSKAS